MVANDCDWPLSRSFSCAPGLTALNKRPNIALLLVLLAKNAVFPVLAVLGVGMQSKLC
jgi:hypothetical protein